MMKKLLFTLLLGTVLLCQAEAKNPPLRHHQLRLGWGDPLFETLAFHEGAAAQDFVRKHDFGYTGHIFLEYEYRLNRVVSFGIQTDIEGIFWKEIGPSRNYDLSILPTLRLTCLNSRYVRLYGGFALGAMVAFDNAGTSEKSPVVNITPLGVQVGNGPWSGTLELGALTAIKDANHVYMLGSRLVSVSVNYSW
ncbi:MAG: hypothetical protein IK074_08190 [Bacteroidales bacterium]|nr:hypothetical protein [Bacteroidales bacterium]